MTETQAKHRVCPFSMTRGGPDPRHCKTRECVAWQFLARDGSPMDPTESELAELHGETRGRCTALPTITLQMVAPQAMPPGLHFAPSPGRFS